MTNLQIDYFENKLTLEELMEKYGLKRRAVNYQLLKSGFTKTTYLKNKYSKLFLEDKLLNNTYENLAIFLNITYGELRTLLKLHGIKRNTHEFYKKNKVNPDFYTSKKYEKEFYYFVGLFLTDGCYHSKNSVRIVIKNKGSFELLKKLANIAGHDNVKSLKTGFNSLSFSDIGLKNKLISIGIPEIKKTYNIRDIFIPNSDCLYSFLVGTLDGDGHIGFQKSKLGYYTSLEYSLCNYNKEFLENLQLKISKLINFKSVIGDTESSIPTLTIGVRNGSKIFFENMYKISPLYLQCKFDTYKQVKVK